MPEFTLLIGLHRRRLQPGLSRIGRDPLCEIQLEDESVSRRHATLRVDAMAVRIADDASRNGIHVNGERVRTPRILTHGDRVRVGTVELRFEVFDEEAHGERYGVGTRPLPKLSAEPARPLAVLSPREREVLTRLARGESYREIAEALSLSTKTVETYRARLGEKLDVRGRSDLVRIALEANLIGPADGR